MTYYGVGDVIAMVLRNKFKYICAKFILKMKLLYLTLVVSFLSLSAFTTNGPLSGIPSVDIKTLEGKTVNIQDYVGKGKITVISFWATWCSPCKKELDAISDIYGDWQSDYNMELLAITVDDSRSLTKVPAMIETKGWEFTVLSDSKSDLRKALNFQAVPQTFLLDENGDIVYSHSGYTPGDEFELEEKIKALATK